MNVPLINYIKKSRELGHSDSDIKSSLLNAGHREEDVRAAFDVTDGKNVVPVPPPPPPPSSPPLPNPLSYGDSSVELPGPTVLLSNAWQIYRARFWIIFSLLLVIVLAYVVFLTFILWLTTFITLFPIAVVLIISLLLSVLVIFIVIRSLIALMFAIASPQLIGFLEAFRISRYKTLSYIWIYLLMNLVITGGFMMLIVPGIIFIAWFSLAQFVFVVEGHKGFNALLRSKEYVVGNWGKVFLRLLFVVIISILISLVIEFSIGLVSKTTAGVVSLLFYALSVPLWLIYIFSLYQALRAKKPELVSRPVGGRKGLFIFSAIFGPIITFVFLLIALLLVLNPSGMLADSRDAQRLNDISTLDSATALYQITTDGILSCVPGKVYSSRDGTTEIDGTGWLPIDFTKILAGSPIPMLPVDSGDDPSYFYTYACDPVNSRFELNARLEGDKFKQKAMEDGGNNPDVYENGTNLNIIK